MNIVLCFILLETGKTCCDTGPIEGVVMAMRGRCQLGSPAKSNINLTVQIVLQLLYIVADLCLLSMSENILQT